MKGIKAIFFDIDNTLLDFMKMKHSSIDFAINAMIKAGLNLSFDEVKKAIFDIYDFDGIESPSVFQKLTKKILGRVDYKIVVSGMLAYRKEYKRSLKTYPGVKKTLQRLKRKYTLVVISDAPVKRAWDRLIGLGLDKYFDDVITAGTVRKTKQYPAPFRRALRKFKLKPSEALMVGDNLSRDIDVAKSLGINTCFARYGNKEIPSNVKIVNADYEINSIKELLKIL